MQAQALGPPEAPDEPVMDMLERKNTRLVDEISCSTQAHPSCPSWLQWDYWNSHRQPACLEQPGLPFHFWLRRSNQFSSFPPPCSELLGATLCSHTALDKIGLFLKPFSGKTAFFSLTLEDKHKGRSSKMEDALSLRGKTLLVASISSSWLLCKPAIPVLCLIQISTAARNWKMGYLFQKAMLPKFQSFAV